MIEVEGLTKRYGDFTAIEDISFRVEKGEIVAFLGPNGAGKTTTMRVVTGFLPATEGSVTVCGFDVFQKPLEVKKRIGYLPEHPPVYHDMTVEEYLRFVSKIKGVARGQRAEAMDRVLQRCALRDVTRTLIGKLSKGYKQRVGLAQAMIHDPKVLILDEPTIGLDPKQIIEIRELIKSLSGEHTIILSTHILQEVSMICQRVLIIHHGRIVADDTLENLTAGDSLESVFLKHTREDVQ
ncbi:MAG: ABC transporter ATP-binding protein [Planctomycetes bacterium]|jgi:ABC-2 type transport system ATP-binding protein|nr:ABC transporter ATP-binding protein [Planctomycetota bacterium]